MPATLTNITGYLYNSQGVVLIYGILSITLQQDMVSVDGTKVAPFSVDVDLSLTGGYIDVSVYATEGATPAGLAYKVEFDADPDNAGIPIKNKNGYWRNYWAVPNTGSVSIGTFVTALRGTPSYNYMPIGGTASSFSDTVTLGTTNVSDKYIVAHGEGKIRYNTTLNRWEFADDGVTFQAMLQGGGGSVGGDLSGTVSAATVTKIRGKAVSSTAPTTTGQFLRWNQSTLQWEPSLDASQFTGNSASSLTTGTLPLARLVDITNAQISATAAIAWTKLSFTGSSLANLATRSAADLSSGTLPLARISGLTNTEISASAAIDASKIANGLVSNTEFQRLDGLDQTPSTTSAIQLLRLGIGAAAHASAALKIVGQVYVQEYDAGSSGTSKTLDWNNGNEQILTLTGSCTLTLTNAFGGTYRLLLTQDGSGGRSVTWPASVLWTGGTAPSLTTTAGKTDLVVLKYSPAAGKYYGAISSNY